MMRTAGRVLVKFGDLLGGRSLPVLAALALVGLTAFGGQAFADQPRPWQIWQQEPATPVADGLYTFHEMLLVIITLITVLVLALLLYCIVRFRAAAHPVPTRTSHNTTIEILWTVLPIVILVVIAVPSFRNLYYQETIPHADMTLKVTGLQWYWHYDYPDYGNFGFDSNLVEDKDLKPGQPRLLTVDNEVVLPVGEVVRVQIQSHDVMHSWFVPSLAAQKYANPGHLNELWVQIERPGVYYGECNQICGVNHSFMPIQIRAVPKEEFAAWVADAKKKFASADGAAATRVASAD